MKGAKMASLMRHGAIARHDWRCLTTPGDIRSTGRLNQADPGMPIWTHARGPQSACALTGRAAAQEPTALALAGAFWPLFLLWMGPGRLVPYEQ